MPPELVAPEDFCTGCNCRHERLQFEASQNACERAVAFDRQGRRRHARCAPLLADDSLRDGLDDRRRDELLVRPDQRDVAAQIRRRKDQPLVFLKERVVEYDQSMSRLLRLVDGMIIHEDELASRLRCFDHHLDPRTDLGVRQRHVACVNMAVHDATREIDSPVEVLDFDVVVGIELLSQRDLLRQLDRDDRAIVDSLVRDVILFIVQRTSPYFSARDEHKFKPYYTAFD